MQYADGEIKKEMLRARMGDANVVKAPALCPNKYLINKKKMQLRHVIGFPCYDNHFVKYLLRN